ARAHPLAPRPGMDPEIDLLRLQGQTLAPPAAVSIGRNMIITPKDVFGRFFAELTRQEIPYVVLHSYEKYPTEVSSDVDYAVSDEDLTRALRIHWTVADQCDWVIAQTFQHEMCGYYTVLIDPDRPEHFLTLDVCSHSARNGCLFLRDRLLLTNRRQYKDFYI